MRRVTFVTNAPSLETIVKAVHSMPIVVEDLEVYSEDNQGD